MHAPALSLRLLFLPLALWACGDTDTDPLDASAEPPDLGLISPDGGAADAGETRDGGEVDETPPVVALTDDAADAVATGPVTFTFLFSESVGDTFTREDVTLEGGTAGAFSAASGTLATLVVVPTPNARGTIVVTVPAQAVFDAAGNGNATGARAEQSFDTRVAEAATVVVAFEEDPSPTLTGFGGAEDATVVADPTNPRNRVGRVLKSAVAETWAGATIAICPNSSVVRLPFSPTTTQMGLRVWSPNANVPIRLKVENATLPGVSVETEARVTQARTWESLTFDFSAPAPGTPALTAGAVYDRVSVFFDFGSPGSPSGDTTYYVDDVAFQGATFPVECAMSMGGGESDLPLTFDAPGVAYLLTGFGGAEDATVVADPDGGTQRVARVVKSPTAELWAGTTISTRPMESIGLLPISATQTRLRVRVRVPVANIPVRLKLEDPADPTKSVETEARPTRAGVWETITFDLRNQAAGTAQLDLGYRYGKASLFFDFGRTGAQGGAGTYYFDDLDMAP